MVMWRRIHRPRIQSDGEGQNTNRARTLALCRVGFRCARRLRSV